MTTAHRRTHLAVTSREVVRGAVGLGDSPMRLGWSTPMAAPLAAPRTTSPSRTVRYQLMTNEQVSPAMLADVISELSLDRAAVAVHVSLRSFPRLAGGPETLVGAFLDRGCTLLVPAKARFRPPGVAGRSTSSQRDGLQRKGRKRGRRSMARTERLLRAFVHGGRPGPRRDACLRHPPPRPRPIDAITGIAHSHWPLLPASSWRRRPTRTFELP